MFLQAHLSLVHWNRRLLMGDFNLKAMEETMSDFMELFDLKNLFRLPTCYKNPEKPSCTDFLLTNKNLCFQDTNAFDK